MLSNVYGIPCIFYNQGHATQSLVICAADRTNNHESKQGHQQTIETPMQHETLQHQQTTKRNETKQNENSANDLRTLKGAKHLRK